VQLPYNSGTNLIGPYILPAYRLSMRLCLTNKVPATPTRGAGRPQGTFVMEMMLDRVARELGIDRDEIRRRNMIGAEQMPYTIPLIMRDGTRMIYDSGDYPKCQQMALDAIGWKDFAERKLESASRGVLRGIGLANYVEGTGRGPFESVGIRVGPSGKIVVSTGATEQGQGLKSMLQQVVAEVLHVSLDRIQVIHGDTAATSLGHGAFASRQTVTAGSSAYQAAIQIREKAKQVASQLLEVSPDDIELVDGILRVVGVPGSGKSIGEIARILQGQPGYSLPRGVTPDLAAEVSFQPEAITHCNGTHAVEIEIDPSLCTIKIVRYIVVHDCGRMINPALVEGQVIGAVVNGIGATLLEWMKHDDQGQPQTVTYADYLLPTADVVPRIEVYHLESPSPLNPLGAKGAGEGGTIGAPAAIASAIEDAIWPLGARIGELPITPSTLFDIIVDERVEMPL
jgi:carbon-monoxide dehydrogenase large subunit